MRRGLANIARKGRWRVLTHVAMQAVGCRGARVGAGGGVSVHTWATGRWRIETHVRNKGFQVGRLRGRMGPGVAFWAWLQACGVVAGARKGQ